MKTSRVISPNDQPNRWYYEQLWRVPFPPDPDRARRVRQALVELKLYPRYDLSQNPNLGAMEANYRAALPDIIAELDRSDLAVVLEVARLLALTPREPGVFGRSLRKRW